MEIINITAKTKGVPLKNIYPGMAFLDHDQLCIKLLSRSEDMATCLRLSPNGLGRCLQYECAQEHEVIPVNIAKIEYWS